ncbi:DNA polymerase [Hoeflea marina]|uniref:Type-4 uracil-DNA glycosylase n=2 Tax=Hoeflea marina TaxID=274592 RepID=A0A317PPN7_9HYPH|nr:DNA polymerase [Hoeflea marina]
MSVSDMSPQSLAALLHFYADAGVDCMIEDAPVDRFAETRALGAMRARPAHSSAQQPNPRDFAATAAAPGDGPKPALPVKGEKAPARAVPPTPQASQLTIPDEAAFADARAMARSANTIEELKAALESFTGCNLRHSAKSMVFADGNPQARVMFIGEAPGRDEDLQGLPFVGRAGQLLDRMLAAIGLSRETAYITNMIPWRPPGNRTPAPHEIELCRPFITRHVALAEPDFVVMLGNVATKALLDTDRGILSIRGSWMTLECDGRRIPALPTLHPAYLLRNPAAKRHVWADLLSLAARLDEPKPA